jgi:hypothetical protein
VWFFASRRKRFVPNPQFLIFVGIAALVFYGVYWLQRRTSRELQIPLEEPGLSRHVVRKALERMGCTITHDSSHMVCGTLPMSGMTWGQEVSVTLHHHMLLVRSTFLISEIIGGSVNQQNVERFAEEWKNRTKFIRTDPAQKARQETFVKENAGSSARTGAFIAIATGLVLAAAIWLPSPNGGSARFRLIALVVPVFMMGCASVWYGMKRVRKNPNKKLVRRNESR